MIPGEGCGRGLEWWLLNPTLPSYPATHAQIHPTLLLPEKIATTHLLPPSQPTLK